MARQRWNAREPPRAKMGEFANRRLIAILAWTVAAPILALNVWPVLGTLRDWLS